VPPTVATCHGITGILVNPALNKFTLMVTKFVNSYLLNQNIQCHFVASDISFVSSEQFFSAIQSELLLDSLPV